MAIFYLDLIEGDQRVEDPEGQDFRSVEAAIAEARLSAREIVAYDLREGRPLGLHRLFEVRDEVGAVAARVTFEEAMP
jgi:hypothetical protein